MALNTTVMDVVSPYGIDPTDEFRSVYGFDHAEDLGAVLSEHIDREYDLQDAVLERLHLGHGIAAFIRSRTGCRIFKLNPDSNARELSVMFERLSRLRTQGLPFPRIHRTRANAWSSAPLTTLPAHGYLLDYVPGSGAATWSEEHAGGTADSLARIHRLGLGEQRQQGDFGLLDEELASDSAMVWRLVDAGLVAEPLISATLERLAVGACEPQLLRTHIHGDARLCHFIFSETALTGIIDVDQGCWGHRLRDVVFHAISHPHPAKVAFLDADQIAVWLRHYDALLPFTYTERRLLLTALRFALLVELSESLATYETHRSDVTEVDLIQGVALMEQLQVTFPL